MTFKTIILCAAAIGAFGVTSATAGSPDVPGAGGQQIKADTHAHLDNDEIPGDFIKVLRDTGGSLGERIQDFSADWGGTPNPGNDEGAGND